MSDVFSVTPHLNGALSDTFQKGYRIIGQLYGRSVRAIQNIPELMKKNPHAAIGVLIAANVVFFTVINAIASWLNTRYEKHPDPVTTSQNVIRYILLDGILVGGAVLAFNHFLSKAINYPLTKLTLAAITTAAIVVRFFACHSLSDDEKAEVAIKKAQEEAALKKAQEEVVLKKAQEEEALKKAQEEEAIKKAQEEEEALKKAQEEEAALKKAQEEEAIKKAQDEAPLGPEDGVCFLLIELKAKYMLKQCKEEGLGRLDALIKQGDNLLELPEHSDYDKITQRTGKFIWAIMQTFPQNEAIKLGSPQERVKAMHAALTSATAEELT